MVVPKLSAHRGGPEGQLPPNSLEAIKATLDIGVDLIEFDVRVTRDGKFISYHNDSIVIGGEKKLIQDITEADALEHASDAFRLQEALELLKGRVMGHVDLKDTRLEVEVADLCESVLGPDGFILTTLEDVSVRRLREAKQHLPVALSLGRDVDGLPKLEALQIRLSELFPRRRVKSCKPTMLAVNYKLARAGVLRWAMKHQLDVLVWTINEAEMIRRVGRDQRYWAFTTDFPRLALQLRDAAGTADVW
jgi:glycerophosphoryl diester phosphodiesterase